MGFALRMILGGAGALLLGVIWFIQGLGGDDPNGLFTGGLWKGPLLAAAGAGAVVMGVRMLRDLRRDQDAPRK